MHSQQQQPSRSMNGKHYQGLSLEGLAAHIASSILLWSGGKGSGTINDCKHAIAHNVRAFQRRLIAKKEIGKILITSDAQSTKDKIELEHAIPIGCLMNLLFWAMEVENWPSQAEAAVRVDQLVRENTILVWVTKNEHAKLNEKYQCTMPEDFDTYPWENVLARYVKTPGVSQLVELATAPNTGKPSENDLDVEIEDDFKESPKA